MKDRKILTIFMVLFLVLNLFSPLVNSGSTIEAQEVSTSEDSVSSSDNSNQSKQILNKDELASTTKSEGEETTVAQEVTSATEQVEEVSKLYSSSTELNTSIKDATETSQEPSEETSVFGDLEKEKIIHDSIIMPATFVFHKTDEFGEPLQGAVFALQDLAGNIIKAVSDEEGKVSFENLKKRYYVLSEIEAPYNYALNKQKYYLTFDDQNNVIIGNEAPRNINSLIENVDFSFEKFLEMYSTSNPERGDYAVSKKDIYPNAPTDHFKTSIRFNINHPVKPGDYFDLVLDDNLKFGYISPNSVKAPDLLLEGTQDILATVDYLAAFNTFRYSFTNIVSPEGKTVENAKINLGIVGIDREKVKYNKDDLTFTNHIGTTEMVSEPFNIIYDLRRPDYGNYYVDGDSYTPSIGTVIKELNEDEDFIDYRIYLNPANQEIYTNGYLDLFGGAINGVTSSYVTENSPITIYKVYPNQFVPSYGMETTNLEDVTSNFETYFIENDGTNRGYYRELNDLMRIRFTEDDFKKGIGYLIDIRLKASEENMAQYKAMALWVNSDQISDMGITTGHGWTLNQVPSGASAIAPKFTPRDLVISNSLEATTTVETTEEPTTVETSEATTTVETTEEPTTVETSEVT
ncbi:SpaA isopeptide-forming pilin-related protein, partial [Facklamia sp. P9177]|uniref:SpaA isopeptide-forming pilin-related protein n=1 Tax=Facklamia sp. P9177 TaxID=3421945 RepID=UPI003D176F2D